MFVPCTGKTHQLRVAAKSMGIALMSDPLYSDKGEKTDEEHFAVKLDSRTMLHASGIHIPPCNGDDDPISVWCDPPFFEELSIEKVKGIEHWPEEGRAFHCAVEKLMTKHCTVPGILDAMMAQKGTEESQLSQSKLGGEQHNLET
jgi:hypothetical protein